MIAPLFVDTGAFLARVFTRDGRHAQAVEGWSILRNTDRLLVSSEHVLDESATLIARRCGYQYAAEWLKIHLGSEELRWLQCSPKDWKAASSLLHKYADQEVSFTDCTSFVLMRREQCREVFGFDDHFVRAGFRLWHGR